MKILMCNSYNYSRGGAERCFMELSALLSAEGHTVIPFCTNDSRNITSPYSNYFVSPVDFPSQLKEQRGLIEKLRVGGRVIYSREAQKQIKNLIQDTQPDIAHIHGIAHEISPSILPIIKQAGIPIVQTLHDYKLLCPNTSFISHGEICEQCKPFRYFNVIRNRCKRESVTASTLSAIEMYVHKIFNLYEGYVDAFISPSQFLNRKLIEHRIENVIHHIPNFVDVDYLQPCYEPERYFVYFGRLVRLKGIMTLLKAMKHVESYQLYVAGGGELERSALAYVQEYEIDNVKFLGHLPASELVPLLQKAAFTVLPSEWYENYPMAALESLACGTPVIGSNIGGIPEIVKDGFTGLLFETGNENELSEKINYLADNPQLAIQMGQNGRKQVEAINNAQIHYQQTMELYQTLLTR